MPQESLAAPKFSKLSEYHFGKGKVWEICLASYIASRFVLKGFNGF